MLEQFKQYNKHRWSGSM